MTDAKAHLSDLVDRVLREHERFVVTRNGRPAAVLVNPDDLEFLLEDLVDDPELSAPGRPKAFELAPEGFAGAYR
ncbi:MAG: type II toxin-antitoxin system Phd/YefM family antitoxin, partial [Acidimicrobiia bacterium]